MDNNGDFYKNLRQKISEWLSSDEGQSFRWTRYIVAAPDLLHLMCKLVIHNDVSDKDKAMLGIAIAYFISPADLIPEAIVGPAGYVDDIALAAHVLNKIIKNNPEAVKQEWAGDEDILELVTNILAAADEMIGTGLWIKIKNMFN